MQHRLLLDHEFVTTQDGYIVRALRPNATLRERAEDLTEMADQLGAQGAFSVCDAKYMGRRACSVGRQRAVYEEKLSRVRRKP